MNNVFIISKPIQYFNATNIAVGGKKTLLIVDNFKNAKEIFLELNESSAYWDRMYFFKVWSHAYNWVVKHKFKIDNIFIDSDYGWTKYKYLRKFNNMKIYVYEEGIGSYRKCLSEKNILGSIKKALYEIVYNNKVYLGGSKYAEGIYLYDKDRFLKDIPNYKKEIFQFNNTFYTHLKVFKDRKVFLDCHTIDIIKKLKNKKVLLYLTSWKYDNKIDDIIKEYNDYYKIIKFHPHIKETIHYSNNFDFLMRGNNLIELVIIELLENCEEVVIFHHGTSAIMYFNDRQKLKTIKI